MAEKRKRRILAIDDEKEFTESVKLQLERSGDYEVMTLNGGVSIEQTALEWAPEIILLDLIMPIADGADIFRLLKRNERLARQLRLT